MGHPAYEARREAERVEAEKKLSEAESAKATFDALTAFMTGRASIHVSPNVPGVGFNIRLTRDPR